MDGLMEKIVVLTLLEGLLKWQPLLIGDRFSAHTGAPLSDEAQSNHLCTTASLGQAVRDYTLISKGRGL